MHSLLPDYLAKLRFDAQQLATLRALGEYRGKQQLYVAQSPEVLSDLRQVAVVESTESSNRLEGVVVAANRLKSLVLKNATPKSRSEQEVAGYRDALGLIHENGEQMPFSEGTVLQLHGILYRYMPQPGGHWKATNNDIVERHPDGSSRIRFRPVAAHLTPMAMTDLIARYRTALDQHLAGRVAQPHHEARRHCRLADPAAHAVGAEVFSAHGFDARGCATGIAGRGRKARLAPH